MANGIIEHAVQRWRDLEDQAEALRALYVRKLEQTQDVRAAAYKAEIALAQARGARSGDTSQDRGRVEAVEAEIARLRGEADRLRDDMAALGARQQFVNTLAQRAKAELERRGLLPAPIPSSGGTGRVHREEPAAKAGFLRRLAGGQG